MSDKRKLSTILGICGATVVAAGGSAFLTNTGMSLLDSGQQTVQESENSLSEKETELPITVEQFAKTKDSFVISSRTATAETNGADSETDADGETAGSTGNTGDTTTSANTMYATGGVNIRSSAGTEGEILGTLNVGEGVTITGERDGNWVQVSYNGQTGYVSGNYLSGSSSGSSANSNTNSGSTSSSTGSGTSGSTSGSTASSTPSWSTTPMGGTMYPTADMNVRSGAGTGSSILGGVSRGQGITVTGYTDNGWIQVSYNGQTGYISENYMSWEEPQTNTGGSNSGAWDDSYALYDINSRYISADELSGWSAGDLAILRNEIFARHGRIFTKQRYIDHFSQKTWYSPTYDPSYFDANLGSFLNDYEWANLEVIQKLEDQLS